MKRSELCKKLNKLIMQSVKDKSKIASNTGMLNTQFDIPSDIANDILTLRTEIQCVDDFILFCITNIFCADAISKYFDKEEIKNFSKSKYTKNTIEFPIQWNMIEIEPDHQWVGKISVKEIMQLRDAHLVNYNPNTQRTMRIIRTETGDIWLPFINKTAVEAIADSYRKGNFIPNAITLNLTEDLDNADFEYDPRNNTLVIKEIKFFDILDGYHRYIAMSNVYNEDPSFDYTMELRIVVFSEEKARQFIYQEDQKTKMKKIDSESYNQNNYANQVIRMLNTETSVFQGIMSSSQYIINPSLMAQVFNNTLFFGSRKKNPTRKELMLIKNDIADKLNQLFKENNDIFDKRWDNKYTIVMSVLLSECKNIDNYCEACNKVIDKLDKDYEYIFRNNVITRQDVLRTVKILEGMEV